MSRDQKPGKFKLVGGAAQKYGRRIDDQVGGEAQLALAAGAAGSDAPAGGRKRAGLLRPVLFLIACAAGGSGAVWLGLVEGFTA